MKCFEAKFRRAYSKIRCSEANSYYGGSGFLALSDRLHGGRALNNSDTANILWTLPQEIQ